MNTKLKLFGFLILAILVALPCSAQVQVWHQDVQQVSVNLRGSAVVLGQRTIDVTAAGKVLVQFDGNCVSTDGDRIVLAASNNGAWGFNDGHVAVEAYNSDINRHSFTHSRMYEVGAGSHTFYAVGQNIVETDGTGIASVYASLTIKFFPNEIGGAFVSHTGIVDTNNDVRGHLEIIEQVDLVFPGPGEVLVRFEGMCVSDPGDRIYLLASNSLNLSSGDGLTLTEALNTDVNTRVFCHSRRYPVGGGLDSFFALAENAIETGGDGVISLYGSFTVEYFPSDTDAVFLQHTGVRQSNVDVEGAAVTMGQLTINPTIRGTAVVRYEGLCLSSPGDRIIMAASNNENWSANAGAVSAEAVSTDLNTNGFSHTRAYEIEPGPATFYAVCQNYVETAGTGVASNYASLSVEFFADPSASAVLDESIVRASFDLETNYPNPFNPATTIAYSLTEPAAVTLRVFDLLGREVRTLVDETQFPGRWVQEWDGKNTQGEPVPSGVYLYQLKAGQQQETRKMMLMK